MASRPCPLFSSLRSRHSRCRFGGRSCTGVLSWCTFSQIRVPRDAPRTAVGVWSRAARLDDGDRSGDNGGRMGPTKNATMEQTSTRLQLKDTRPARTTSKESGFGIPQRFSRSTGCLWTADSRLVYQVVREGRASHGFDGHSGIRIWLTAVRRRRCGDARTERRTKEDQGGQDSGD